MPVSDKTAIVTGAASKRGCRCVVSLAVAWA
jgi:hypothetical protein